KPPKNDNGPKPPKPPKPGDPIVDRDGPVRPGPGWQPRVRRTATAVVPAAAMSTAAPNPVQAGTLSNTNRQRRAQIADQSPRINAEALPQQNPRNQRLAGEPQARAANQAAPTRAARPQSEARSRPEPAPRPARQERASKNDDRDP
ncbi:MAG: hypothetical protein ACOVMK_00935, partial [Arenimonas sp.]